MKELKKLKNNTINQLEERSFYGTENSNYGLTEM